MVRATVTVYTSARSLGAHSHQQKSNEISQWAMGHVSSHVLIGSDRAGMMRPGNFIQKSRSLCFLHPSVCPLID